MALSWQDARAVGQLLPGRGRENTLRLVHQGRAIVLKRYLPEPLSVRRIRHALAAVWHGGLPVEDMPPAKRRDFERETLALWKEHGFRVPAVVDVPLDERPGEALLATEWVEGPTLQSALENAATPLDERLELVRTVLSDCARRHRKALSLAEPRLVHFDSNTGNILFPSEGPVHVDFEMGRLYDPVRYSASFELAKLTGWAAGDLGGAVDEVARVAVDAYAAMPEIVQDIPKRVFGRWGQVWHRRRDRRRHQADPATVTLFDVAKAIVRALN